MPNENFNQGFPPVVDPQTRVLVLGSMPSIKSLSEQAYYAHPRNGFWPLMGNILAFDSELPYAARLQNLLASGVGLWDVYAGCERKGSLDSAIINATAEFNDFVALFNKYPGIRLLTFNGKTAFNMFHRLVKQDPELADFLNSKKLLCLPSTSPANAAVSISEKQLAWQSIRDFLVVSAQDNGARGDWLE